MFADSSTRSAARSTAGAASGTRSRSCCSSMLGERRRPIEVARLRQIPQHELDVARRRRRRSARGRRRRRSRSARRPGRTRRRRSTRRSSTCRIDALACRLMNRSALLLFAIAVRSSIATFRSSSRVSRTRSPSRASMTPFTRRAIASVTSFSLAPAGALDAGVLAAVARIDGDGVDRRARPARRTAAARAAAAAAASRRRRRAGRRAPGGDGVSRLRAPADRSPAARSCRPAGSSP